MNILLLDDDHDFCALIGEVCKSVDVKLDAVHTLRDAYSAMNTHAVELYMVDGYLPDGSGIDFIHDVRARRGRDAKVCFVSSGYTDAESFRTLKETCGADFVLNKPLQPGAIQEVIRKVRGAGHDNAEDDTDHFLQSLKEDYDRTIFSKIKYLETGVERVLTDPDDQALVDLKNNLHKIAGTAGSYGYKAVSRICSNTEQTIHQALETKRGRNIKWSSVLQYMLKSVKIGFQLPKWEPGELPVGFEPQEPPIESVHSDVLIVTKKHDLIQQVVELSEAKNIDVMHCEDPEEAETVVRSPYFKPSVILVDQYFSNSPVDGYDLIKTFRATRKTTNTLLGIFSSQDEIEERMKALQTGIDLFLAEPILAEHIVELCVGKVGEKAAPPEYPVLLVDDDAELYKLAQHAMEEIGIGLSHVATGGAMFDQIKEEPPSLIILDVSLPDFNGLELLRALRADNRHQDTCIVMLTVNHSSEAMFQAFDSGADGFIFKPIQKDVFQAMVLSYRRRHELMDAQRSRDYLTGLRNRRSFSELFEIAAGDSRRMKKSMALALLDIDSFKIINDKFGHPAGDEVLARLGAMLLNAFRKEDLVARWGGEEFVILFRSMSPRQAVFLMGNLLQEVRKQCMISSQPEHQVTFSCGIASFPEQGDNITELSMVADHALLTAKNMGKNRVLHLPDQTAGDAVPKLPHLLIVEDDADILPGLTLAFESIGFKVTIARTLKEAKSILMDLLLAYGLSLIIIDQVLPDGNGLDLLDTLEQQDVAEIPALILSQVSDDKSIQTALNKGAVDYIVKPFSLSALVEKINRLLESMEDALSG